MTVVAELLQPCVGRGHNIARHMAPHGPFAAEMAALGAGLLPEAWAGVWSNAIMELAALESCGKVEVAGLLKEWVAAAEASKASVVKESPGEDCEEVGAAEALETAREEGPINVATLIAFTDPSAGIDSQWTSATLKLFMLALEHFLFNHAFGLWGSYIGLLAIDLSKPKNQPITFNAAKAREDSLHRASFPFCGPVSLARVPNSYLVTEFKGLKFFVHSAGVDNLESPTPVVPWLVPVADTPESATAEIDFVELSIVCNPVDKQVAEFAPKDTEVENFNITIPFLKPKVVAVLNSDQETVVLTIPRHDFFNPPTRGNKTNKRKSQATEPTATAPLVGAAGYMQQKKKREMAERGDESGKPPKPQRPDTSKAPLSKHLMR